MTARSITRSPAELMVAELAADLTEQLLQVRRVYLKKREPRSQYQRDVRTGISCRRSTPIEKCLTVSLADLEDGAPLGAVLAPYLSIIELLRARAQEIASVGVDAPSLLGVIQREDRAEANENDAERRVLAEPESVDALDALLDNSAKERIAQDARDNAVRSRKGVLLNRQLQRAPLASSRERVAV